MPNSTDPEKSRRKRRKKDLDKIHSKILKAKKKLDDVGKNGSTNRQRSQKQAKICTRLLPESTIGIYRNGTKGKIIQKDPSNNTIDRARLKADALKLFNGDTSDSKYADEQHSIHNETTEQSPNKNFVKNRLKCWTSGSTLEQSPVLGERQNKNQNLCLIQEENEETFVKNLDSDKIKQNINNASIPAAKKENAYNQKLFQNDKVQSKATNIAQIQIFDNGDFMGENIVQKNRTQQIHEDSKKSKILNDYKELCKMVSTVNFGGDFQQKYQLDPLVKIIKKLRYTYSDSLYQQYLHERNKLETVKSPALSEEHQACTHSDISQMSPNSTLTNEYKVPKYNKSRRNSPFLLEDIPEKDEKIHSIRNENIESYDSISCLSQNILETYDTNDCIIKSRKNNSTQHSKQSADVHQSKTAITFHSANERDSIQKHSNYINCSSKNKQYNKDKFYINFCNHENSQQIDDIKQPEVSIFPSKSTLLTKKYSSKNYACKESPIINIYSRMKKKYNRKNVKQPVTLHQYNNIEIDHRSIQENDEDLLNKERYEEKLYKQFGININDKININDRNLNNKKLAYIDSFHQRYLREKNEQKLKIMKSSNQSMDHQACTNSNVSQASSNSASIFEIDGKSLKYRKDDRVAFPLIKDISRKKNKFHLTQSEITPYCDVTKGTDKMQFPNTSKYYPTPSIANAQLMNFYNQTKTFESQINPMEMQDSQDSLVEKFNVNMHSSELDQKNKLYHINDPLQTFVASYNTNVHIEQLAREQEQVLPKTKKHLFYFDYDPISELRDANSCIYHIKSQKPLSQQTKLHICERNDEEQRLLEKNLHNRNQNVFFNSIDARTVSSPTLNFSQNIPIDNRFEKSIGKKIFSRANVECARNQTNLSDCNEQYAYLNSARCNCKYNISQRHHNIHKGTVQTIVQPGILHKDRNIRTDNYIALSNDIPTLLLEPNQPAYTYPKVIDDQHRPMLLQNTTQPRKYLAINNNSEIQRIPVYISDKNVTEDTPLKVITLVKPNIQTEELYFHKKYNSRYRK